MSLDLGGAIAGGVITYEVNGVQRVAATSGMVAMPWPTPPRTGKIVVMGLGGAGSGK